MKPEQYTAIKGVFFGRQSIGESEIRRLVESDVRVGIVLVFGEAGWFRRMEHLTRESRWMQQHGMEPVWYAWAYPREVGQLADRLERLRDNMHYRPDLFVLNFEYDNGWPSERVSLDPLRDALPSTAFALCANGLIDRSWSYLAAQVELGMPMSYRNDESPTGDVAAIRAHRESWNRHASGLPLWHCLGANDKRSDAPRMTRLAEAASTVGCRGAAWWSALGLRSRPERLDAVAQAFRSM